MSPTMQGEVHQNRWVPRSRLFPAVVVGLLNLFVMFGCSGMPTLAEQEQKIRNNDLTLRKLEPRAFVRAWGQPTYQHMEFMPFFGMKDGSLVPRSRLAVGEAPPGWEAGIDAGDALFLAYPDHGWLVVFLDETFVYREELSAEKLHEIGRTWAHEDKFRTSIEKQAKPTP
jgi:hypothetical protein